MNYIVLKQPNTKILINKLFIFLIYIYQNIHIFPSSCKYIPTCSEYAKEAFKKYNFFKAFSLTLFRLIKCNPFSYGGFDPLK